jgi:hypothetical protein
MINAFNEEKFDPNLSFPGMSQEEKEDIQMLIDNCKADDIAIKYVAFFDFYLQIF